MMVLNEKLEGLPVFPVTGMDNKFHSNQSSSCFHQYFTQNHKCEPHGGATGKVRGSSMSLGHHQ